MLQNQEILKIARWANTTERSHNIIRKYARFDISSFLSEWQIQQRFLFRQLCGLCSGMRLKNVAYCWCSYRQYSQKKSFFWRLITRHLLVWNVSSKKRNNFCYRHISHFNSVNYWSVWSVLIGYAASRLNLFLKFQSSKVIFKNVKSHFH